MFVFYIRFAWVTSETLHSWPEEMSNVSLRKKINKAKKAKNPRAFIRFCANQHSYVLYSNQHINMKQSFQMEENITSRVRKGVHKILAN